MKKIPTLFERRFEGKKIVEVLPEVKKGLEQPSKDGEVK